MEIHSQSALAAQYPSTGNICAFATDAGKNWIGEGIGIHGLSGLAPGENEGAGLSKKNKALCRKAEGFDS